MNEPGGDDRADSADSHDDNRWAEDYQPEGEPPEESVSEEYEAEDYLPEDAEPLDDDDVHTALPGKVEAWRRRSATGAVLTGFALGLQQVFEPKKDEPSIIMQTSGEPPKDLPVEADFEYGRPRSSVVNIRPWLLPGDEQADKPQASNDASNGGAGNDDGQQEEPES
ncbi:MAG TPA: hypothetical protein VFV02_11465 [Acidimicrobiales bacterium]|nr:hypothetical protein [Acidimicrobiales bacterium]